MSLKLYNEQYISNIANNVREMGFTQNNYTVKQMSQNLIELFQCFKNYIEGTIQSFDFSLLTPNLTNIHDQAFYDCPNLILTDLPNSITEIGWNAFSGCKSLEIIRLPKSLNILDQFAFDDCSNLKIITFQSVPQIVRNEVFRRCNNLTTINVPWSEGEVANAPWGAINATINYNYGPV